MSALINFRELRRQIKHKGIAKTANHLCESLDKGDLSPNDFSIRQLYESIFGFEAADALNPRYHGAGGPALPGASPVPTVYSRSSNWDTSGSLAEAIGGGGGIAYASAVSSAAFSNITGQIVYNTLLEAYDQEDLIGEKITTNVPTQLNGERIAGVGGIGDEAETVREGEQYPFVGLTEQWIETPQTTKRGMIIPITREAIFFDRTGMVLEEARKIGDYFAVNKERRILRAVFGIDNTYSRNGVATNTFLTSGAYTNSHTNALVDFSDIENAENLLYTMVDPNTGLPIRVTADTIIVPFALRYRANMIVNASEVQLVDNQANPATTRFIGPNPLNKTAVGPYQIAVSRFVKDVTGSDSTWFLGKPTGAFKYMENWPATVVQAAANSHDEFHRDIVQQFKVSERGAVAVVEPRYMVKNTG